MTFLDPDSIVPVMDAITRGWQYGRSVQNLQFENWESTFEKPLTRVRLRYRVVPDQM